MEQEAQPQRGSAAAPASAAAAQDGAAQGAPDEQDASPASESAVEAGAACLVSIAAAAVADEPGSAPSGSGTSSGRKKTTAMKHHNPLKTIGRKVPSEKSNLGPKVRPTGKARKSTQMSAAQPAAPAGEGQSAEAPQQPVGLEEELQGASEEDIARVNVEYNLTTPHEVGTRTAHSGLLSWSACRMAYLPCAFLLTGM